MADEEEKTAETDAVVIKEGAGDAVVVEGTVDDPPTTAPPTAAAPAPDSPSGDAPSTTPPPSPSPPPALGGSPGGTSPAAADRQASEETDPFAEKPELFVAGAFLGGIVLAKLIGALFGPDDD